MQRKRLSVLLILLLLVACQNSQREEAFRAKYQDIPMNVDLQFWKPKDNFIVGESLSLELENFSANKIVFSLENNVTIFTFENGEWVEVSNNTEYYPPNIYSQISPKGPESPGVISIGLSPQINSNTKSPIKIRVVVVGYLYRGDEKTDDRTGAYIDIKLEP